MRLPAAFVLATSLALPAFATPAADLPHEELARTFLSDLGAGDTVDASPIDFDAFLNEHFLRGSFGIYDIYVPQNAGTDEDSLEKVQTVVLALLDSQDVWLDWLEPASGKQKVTRKDLKTVRGWVKGWKTKNMVRKADGDERELFAMLEASDKIKEAAERLAASMANGEALGLSREGGQREPLILIPARKQFVEFAMFCGLAFPADQGGFWHDGTITWTNFYAKNYKVLALEYAAPGQKEGGYAEGMSMDYRSPTGMAQQIVQLAANSMLDNYFGAAVPPSIVGSLSLNLVVAQFGECDTRADGDLRSRRKEAREVFISGGQSEGGQLPADLADSRWRVNRGAGFFVSPLRRAQKGGADAGKGKDRFRHFELMLDDESGRTTISGPYLGSAAASANAPPKEYFVDHVEFLRAYRACFVWWLQTSSIGSEKKSAKGFATLLQKLAASTDPEELESLFAESFDGSPLSSTDLDKSNLEGRFLTWLGKQK